MQHTHTNSNRRKQQCAVFARLRALKAHSESYTESVLRFLILRGVCGLSVVLFTLTWQRIAGPHPSPSCSSFQTQCMRAAACLRLAATRASLHTAADSSLDSE
eukprot:2631594-Rhodomonas_salina.1